MALAVRSLGDRRAAWALAMQAEFEAAKEDGKELPFAVGCLIAACRELPAQEEGRLAMATHAFALIVLVPIAALMISSVLTGFPTSYLGHTGIPGLPQIIGEQGPLISEANRSAIPALALLVLLLAALNLRIAWLALDRDWTRLAAAAALGAATTATLVIFSAVVFAEHVAALAHAAVLTAELTAVSALARWHARISSAVSKVPIRQRGPDSECSPDRVPRQEGAAPLER